MVESKELISLFKIKAQLSAEVYGKYYGTVEDKKLKKIFINGVSTLEQSSGSQITFFSGKKKYKNALVQTKARACLIDFTYLERLIQQDLRFQKIYFVVVKDLNLAFAKIMALFYSVNQTVKDFISKDASIEKSAVIGKNCEIMSGSYIGKNAKIGDNVKIYPNAFVGDKVEIGDKCIIFHAATIFHATIGKNTIIHSGARIGKDGFRYVTDGTGKHIKVPHIGQVTIGNDVEIGANSTIDRGSISDTVIGDMCKLDNLVQIGHNVVLGKGCFIVSQVGIAGSVLIGNYVMIGGQAGIADNLSIGNYVKIAAKAGVMRDILEKEIVIGSPAQSIRQFFKQVAIMKKMTKKEKA